MNPGEHMTTRGGKVNGKQKKPHPALVELHQRLSDALAVSGLNKTLLARRARLGRTTVAEAIPPGTPVQVPSAATVTALAVALSLSADGLLELRRAAATGQSAPDADEPAGLGKLISQWDPHDLEVHPAGGLTGGASSPRHQLLPRYVRRQHDAALSAAVEDVKAGRSRMLVLVGTSSTGKTRACWEAVAPLADEGWRLWHPFDPTRADAALADIARIGRRTVVWLNEAQHYLGDAQSGERVAAALHTLLTDAKHAPVLVLGTLWPQYERQYTALPDPDNPDSHSRVRELLAGRVLTVPDGFDAEALRAASILAKAGDRLLAGALTRAAENGQVTQDLAGAPELLRRYEHSSPAARALLEAAMDARRLGVGPYLPQTFLTDAAIDYMEDADYDAIPDQWELGLPP